MRILAVLLHRHAPVLFDGPKWVVRDLPGMSARVGKISGVSAPEGFLRLLEYGCAMVFQSSKYLVDFRFASDVYIRYPAFRSDLILSARYTLISDW
jgi:hypothetical protein